MQSRRRTKQREAVPADGNLLTLIIREVEGDPSDWENKKGWKFLTLPFASEMLCKQLVFQRLLQLSIFPYGQMALQWAGGQKYPVQTVRQLLWTVIESQRVHPFVLLRRMDFPFQSRDTGQQKSRHWRQLARLQEIRQLMNNFYYICPNNVEST